MLLLLPRLEALEWRYSMIIQERGTKLLSEARGCEAHLDYNDMMADIFTKAVVKDTFLKFRMWQMNEPIKDRSSRLGRAVQRYRRWRKGPWEGCAVWTSLQGKMRHQVTLARPGQVALRRGNFSRDGHVNDMAFPMSHVKSVCVNVHTRVCILIEHTHRAYLWGNRGNVSSGSRVILCAERLA